MKKTTLLKSMFLLFALIVGSLNSWADTVTRTENFASTGATTNAYDCSSSIGTASNQTDWDYEWTPSGNGTVFKNGIKLGKSNGTGSVANTTMLSGISTGTSITIKVYAARWNTDTGNLTVTYNGSSESKAPANSAITTTTNTYSASDFSSSTNFTITKAADVTSFSIASSTKRIIIDKVEVVYEVTASGTTAAPTISGAEDFFTTRLVSITNAPSADGASIYYTLNGDDPTTTPSATCFAYTAPFEVSATTTVKAIAKHEDDTNASSVVSKTFTKQTTLNGITALNAAENGTYYVVFTKAQFTYFNGNQGFLNDANAGILYFKEGHPDVKTTYDGICLVEKTVYKGMPELTNIEAIDGECEVTTDELQAPVVVTASELETNFSNHLARQIQVNNYTVTDADNFADGKAFYTVWFNPALTVGCTYNLVGYPFNNNGTMQYRLVAATVPVTISASKYASFCSTSALDFTDTDVKAYKAKVDEGKVVLTQVDNVPANEGVILYCETPGDYNVPVIASASAVTENELIGVTSRTLVEWETGGDGKYNYILQQGAFKKATDGGYLKANRAYLHTTYDVASPGAHDLEMVFDGDVTGIKNLTTTLSQGEGVAYNLAGQRVNANHKGLVIVNGKKYLNK